MSLRTLNLYLIMSACAPDRNLSKLAHAQSVLVRARENIGLSEKFCNVGAEVLNLIYPGCILIIFTVLYFMYKM